MSFLIALILGITAAHAQEASMLPVTVDQAIKAACSDCIDGIGLVDQTDKSTWRLDFKKDATDEQKKQAEKAMEAFDLAAPLPAPEPTIDEKLQTLQDKVNALEAAKAAPAKAAPAKK